MVIMQSLSTEPLPHRPRIVFMGTPDFAVPALRSLVESGHRVTVVVTQPDRPRGRGLKPTPSPVKEMAQAQGIPVLQPESVNRPEVADRIREGNPDLMVVVAFGQILKTDLLSMPPWGVLNIHASLLPRHRGAAPIQWAVLEDDRRTGLTLMQMDEGLDTGPILFQEEVDIREGETAGDLHDRLAEQSGPFLIRSLSSMSRDGVFPTPQDEARATYAPKITREMTLIDWNEPAFKVAALIRALDPVPGAVTFLGDRRLKLFSAAVDRTDSGEIAPGMMLEEGEHVVVGTGEGRVSVAEIQVQGRRRMPVRDFLHGFSIAPGSRLGI